jgi:hypothetical protein
MLCDCYKSLVIKKGRLKPDLRFQTTFSFFDTGVWFLAFLSVFL